MNTGAAARRRTGFVALLAALAVLSFPLAVRPCRSQDGPAGAPAPPPAAADSSDALLAATSEPPWNPDRPVPAHEPWESALNTPLTVASLPVRVVGAGVRSGLMKVQEDLWIPRAQVLLVRPPWGLGASPADLGARTGFGGAITFEPPPLHGWLRARLEGSTLRYGRGHVELGTRALYAAYTHDWRPQEPFFGTGMAARETDVSDYSLRARRAELRAHAVRAGAVRAALEAWAGERRVVARRGRDPQRPSLDQVFPALADALFDAEQDHVFAGGSLTLDARAGRPHWSRGWRVSGQAEIYGHPPGGNGVLFAGRRDSPAFGRTTLSAETGVSFMRDPRTVRLSARVVDTHAADGNHPPAILDLPTLGGSAGLTGFEPGRFHGADLVAARVAYVFPLAEHAEFEVSAERGGVFDDVWGGARLDRTRTSYGVSYRLRTDRVPIAAVGLDWSREATRVRFALGGVE